MKQSGWCFLFVATNSHSRVRQVRFSGVLAAFVLVFVLAGATGFFRLARFSLSYSVAKMGVFRELRENEGLLLKARFLSRFIQKESDKINALIAFEDRERIKYGMPRISDDVRKAGVGGRPGIEESIFSSILDPIVLQAETVRESLAVLLRQAELQDSTFSRMAEQVSHTNDAWMQRPSIWPVRGRVTSTFGYRFHPFLGHNLFHSGIDIANKIWTPVFVTADGIVRSAGTKDYFGKMVIVDHPRAGYQTAYAHLHQFAVSEGQVVKRGALIGYVGNSGRSTGPHLHYEVRSAGKILNPMSYILPTDVIID